MKKILFINILFVAVIALLVLALCVKGGRVDTTDYLRNDKAKAVGGPFESSSSTSRYILTEAIVKRSTFLLTKDEAKFASPDVSLYNNKFLSIFMPGISFIGVPFYFLGAQLGMAQLVTYLSVAIFGFVNIFLIARIVYKLGANLYAGLLGGFLFLFGTNAFSYSLFYTQHITSVTFLLVSLLMAMGKRTLLKNIGFGMAAGVSLLLDVPNVIFLAPVGLYLLSQYVHVQTLQRKISLSVNLKFATVLLGLIPFLVFLAWYNVHATGSYTKIGQTIGQSDYFRIKDKKEKQVVSTKLEHKSNIDVVPFKPRAQINGFYTLLVSDERSWLVYSPIVWLGVCGFAYLYRQKKKIGIANAIVGTIFLNILIYSMFDDPWGGWSFGPRYLIPAAAMLCIGLGLAIKAYGRKLWFMVVFGLTAFYSVTVNVLGALTTNAVPPKTEALHLPNPIPYNYLYNIQLVHDNKISSLFYNSFFHTLSGWMYVGFIVSILAVTVVLLYQLADE